MKKLHLGFVNRNGEKNKIGAIKKLIKQNLDTQAVLEYQLL